MARAPRIKASPPDMTSEVRCTPPSTNAELVVETWNLNLTQLTDAEFEAKLAAMTKERTRRENERELARRQAISDCNDHICEIVRGLAWQQVLAAEVVKRDINDTQIDLTRSMWSGNPQTELCMAGLRRLVDAGTLVIESGDRSTSMVDVLEALLDGTASGTPDDLRQPLDSYELVIRVSRG